MTSRARGVAVLSVVLALDGCALPPSGGGPPCQAPATTGCVDGVVASARDVASLYGLSPEELRRTLEERRAAYAADPTRENRTRLALALALGRPDTRLPLPLEADRSPGGRESGSEAVPWNLCALAQVLLGEIAERDRRLDLAEDEATAQRQRISELDAGMRRALARNRELERRLGATRRELAIEHAESETLQQQLEGLRDIERSLGARRSGAPLPPPPDYDAEQGQGPAGR